MSRTLNPLVDEHLEEVEAACLRYGVRQLDLFGSAAAGGRFGNDSDLDFLVAFETAASQGFADRYFGLLESLEGIFGRPIDLVVEAAITNPYFREAIEGTRALLYAA